MSERFHATYFTPDVLSAQKEYYGKSYPPSSSSESDPLGADEREFIEARDSFYLGTVTSDGWPYIQHRGGPPGFLRVLDPRTLGFADLRGNRQLISTGNLAGSDKAALFLMDYPRRARLKIVGRARTLDARGNRELADRLTPSPELRTKIERLMLIDVVSYDWNCQQYITPRFTEVEVRAAVAPLHERIARLEAELERTRAR
jgi:predicted pyridoxine 5'-phosphate oxidase superfamily flavin-nucleotide-binding protein